MLKNEVRLIGGIREKEGMALGMEFQSAGEGIAGFCAQEVAGFLFLLDDALGGDPRALGGLLDLLQPVQGDVALAWLPRACGAEQRQPACH